MIFRNPLEVENNHFIMAEVRNFETFLQVFFCPDDQVVGLILSQI